ncbi:MAG: hypothetical protein IIV87_01300, partial [Oscillospiraceae bacterium]|nr:hypothetical protein [Oscillospiraceae bacterium]
MKQNRLDTYEYLLAHAKTGAWAERILAELGYLLEISKVQENALDERLEAELTKLLNAFKENGVICKADALAAEEALADLGELAKSYDTTCVAHAHIDMNWMWGYHETAALTVDTFRTMLKLMDEYPEFTFSQSQASTYRIIEQHYPEMLDEIRKRVK